METIAKIERKNKEDIDKTAQQVIDLAKVGGITLEQANDALWKIYRIVLDKDIWRYSF